MKSNENRCWQTGWMKTIPKILFHSVGPKIISSPTLNKETFRKKFWWKSRQRVCVALSWQPKVLTSCVSRPDARSVARTCQTNGVTHISGKRTRASRIHFVDKSAAERAAGLFLYANIGQGSRQVWNKADARQCQTTRWGMRWGDT